MFTFSFDNVFKGNRNARNDLSKLIKDLKKCMNLQQKGSIFQKFH